EHVEQACLATSLLGTRHVEKRRCLEGIERVRVPCPERHRVRLRRGHHDVLAEELDERIEECGEVLGELHANSPRTSTRSSGFRTGRSAGCPNPVGGKSLWSSGQRIQHDQHASTYLPFRIETR